MNWSDLFFTPEGRIGRKPFLLAVAILWVAGLAVHVLPLLGGLLWLMSLYCWICVLSKRLHDMGRTGWLQLAPMVIGVGGLILGGLMVMASILGPAASGFVADHLLMGLGAMIGGMWIGAALLALAVTIHLLFLLWLSLSPGQTGDNRFGPRPAPSPGMAL